MYERLLNILDTVGRTRVLLVGDFMLDYYLYGNTDRISPEAPVPVLNVTRRDERPGGAGSVAVDLAALETQVMCLGVVGDDAHGRRLRDDLASLDGCDVSGLLTVDDRPTTIKQRIIGLAQHRHRQQLMRVDEESIGPLSAEAAERVMVVLQEKLVECDVVCLEDYNKGVLSGGMSSRLIQAARQAGKRVIVDPAAAVDYARYADAWLVKPNRRELALATGVEPNAHDDVRREACRQLATQHRIENLVVTLDKEGAYLYRHNPQTPAAGLGEVIPTRGRNVYDVTGAGDMVLAMLGLLIGGDYGDAPPPDLGDVVRLANFAGGLEVEQFGAVGIPRHEILAELAHERHGKAGKLRTSEDLLRELGWHRRHGHKVVFTNGCFDILHPGHIHLLTFAKEQGDVLVVAINSDDSVRQLKGPTRPILKQNERAALLAALEAVDYVVIFDEPDPGELIRSISPDVLVKGSDWRGAVVGQDWVESHGGRVALMPLMEGHSTTNIIQQVLNQHVPGASEGKP